YSRSILFVFTPIYMGQPCVDPPSRDRGKNRKIWRKDSYLVLAILLILWRLEVVILAVDSVFSHQRFDGKLQHRHRFAYRFLSNSCAFYSRPVVVQLGGQVFWQIQMFIARHKVSDKSVTGGSINPINAQAPRTARPL
ncbi:hypothetical protein MO867_17775, partial [Microbulbifer sp. OS29]